MLFTLIVPIHNVEEYLPRCVDSILAQSFTDFEVLLVDDGSTDRCPALCDAYAAQYPCVRVIHKPNGGLISARNAGIMAARGDYIGYVDGDDWVKPGMLAFVHERLEKSPVVLDMVMFAADRVYENGSVPLLHNVREGYYDRAALEREIFPHLLTDRRRGFRAGTAVQGHTWNKFSRRELQREYYVRDERIRMFTDVPFTYEILLNCEHVYISNERLYYYNSANPDSILARGKQYYLTPSFRYLVLYLRERLSSYGPEIRRQLNDYPVTLIARTAGTCLRTDGSFRAAVRHMRAGLDESGMAGLVSLRGLPPAALLLTLLFKLRMDTVAMALCALRLRRRR